jgi:hypothetical protein
MLPRMSDPKPYRATADELRAIDEGLLDVGGPPVPDSDLPAFYRSQAAQYRVLADRAETIEMRIKLLEFAEQLDVRANTSGS